MMIPREQFTNITGDDRDKFPMEVRLMDFHKWLNKETGGMWPADGEGTFCANF